MLQGLHMAIRRFISKELTYRDDTYIGQYGELWISDTGTILRVGNNTTPGGIPLGGGGGTAGPTTVCPPSVNTVIYTASSSAVRTIKATVQAVGYETGVVDFLDTHSAEIMAIKNLRTSNGDASVYGVTYTSVNSLVTFDAQVIGGILKITAQPTSGVNSVTVKSIAIEIQE